MEVLRLILEKDRNAIFDKDEDDNTPLHLAAKAKHSEAVDFLLCQGASVHKRSVELEKELDIAKLIMLSTNVGTPNTGRRWTALQRPGHTTAPCCCSTMTLQVSHNLFCISLNKPFSSVDPKDRKNVTPLHLAAMYGHEKVARLLLDHAANLALEDDEGMNALELAIFHRNKNVVEV